MIDLHVIAARARGRARLRGWEYRQRNHAKGVWYRLRRVLAESASAWAIQEEHAQQLITEGVRPEPVGSELNPPKIILFVDPNRLAGIAERRELRVQLDSELLGERCIALVAFPR